MRSSLRISAVLALVVFAGACSKREAPDGTPTKRLNPAESIPAGIGTSPPIGKPEPLRPPTGGPKGDPRCSFVTAEDVKAITGVDVVGREHTGPDICGAYGTEDKELVAIGRRDGGFDALVGAVPAASFPTRRELTGLGDSAVQLSSGQGTQAQIFVRKGEASVFFVGTGLTEAQLQELARRVVPRL
jgi:hypothetical protein